MRDNIHFHRKSTHKSPSSHTIVDYGENAFEYPRSHAIIHDKGYVGSGDFFGKFVICLVLISSFTHCRHIKLFLYYTYLER